MVQLQLQKNVFQMIDKRVEVECAEIHPAVEEIKAVPNPSKIAKMKNLELEQDLPPPALTAWYDIPITTPVARSDDKNINVQEEWPLPNCPEEQFKLTLVQEHSPTDIVETNNEDNSAYGSPR